MPGYPVTPVLSVLARLYILYSLHWYTWIAFLRLGGGGVGVLLRLAGITARWPTVVTV